MTIPWGDALGRHFRLREMVESRTARRDPEMWAAQENPPEHVVHNLERLVNLVLDPLRDAFDHPILVNSGYRCEALNAAVGGSPRSQHRLGQAADIRLAPGWTLEDAPAAIREGRVRELLPDDAPPMAFLFAELATEEEGLEPGSVVHPYPFDQLIHEFGSWPAPAWVHVSIGPRHRRQVLAATRRHGYIRTGSYAELASAMVNGNSGASGSTS